MTHGNPLDFTVLRASLIGWATIIKGATGRNKTRPGRDAAMALLISRG
jgi:hypothetical protein